MNADPVASEGFSRPRTPTVRVALVLVSHSSDIATGTAELARQIAPDVLLLPAGGVPLVGSGRDDPRGVGSRGTDVGDGCGGADVGDGSGAGGVGDGSGVGGVGDGCGRADVGDGSGVGGVGDGCGRADVGDGCGRADVGGDGAERAPARRGLGTSAAVVHRAIERALAATPALGGVVVLTDLGSAVMTAETVIELLEPGDAARVRLPSAPFVEGAVVAALRAQLGGSLDEVAADAVACLQQRL